MGTEFYAVCESKRAVLDLHKAYAFVEACDERGRLTAAAARGVDRYEGEGWDWLPAVVAKWIEEIAENEPVIVVSEHFAEGQPWDASPPQLGWTMWNPWHRHRGSYLPYFHELMHWSLMKDAVYRRKQAEEAEGKTQIPDCLRVDLPEGKR